MDQQRLDRARALGKINRHALDNYIETATTAEINEVAALFAEWTPGAYEIGDKRNWQGIPYHCIQAHDSAPNPGWTPDAVPALWAQYHGTSRESARAFVKQGENPYMVGEWALIAEGGDEDVQLWPYRCKIDNTVHSPAEYAPAWERWVEPVEAVETEPEDEPEDDVQLETDEGVKDYSVDVAVSVGDLLRYNGVVYRVLQAHTTAAHWPPNALPALYKAI